MASFSKSLGTVVSGENVESDHVQLRRGPWTHDEDSLLIQNVARHGEGRWNLLAKRSGLKRTGKSCRLRWLNYLKPDVKRGNLTPHEQVSILELHSKWGNRWSKIAQHLPGRTDNEIKNYWRTRVQKQARHLKIDANSRAFQEIVQGFWMPRLLQKMGGSSTSSSSSSSLAGISENPSVSDQQNFQNSASAQCHQVPCEQGLVGENGRANKFDSSSSSDSEQGIGANISSSESINFSQVSQFSDYPSAAASTHNAHDTSGGYFCQFENNRYDMEAINQQPESTIPSPVVGDFDNWVYEYDLGAHNMWNMDELWQFRNS